MKTLQHFLFLVILFLLISIQSQAGVISFEDPTLPLGWSVSKGSLGISNEKVKLGNSALRWQWTAGDILSAINPDNLSQVSTNKGGGLTLWIYNQTASDATLEFAFYNLSDEKKGSLRFKLNYRGWRCLWAEFKNDMGHDLSTLSTLKIIAPSTTGNGTVFLDYLEFTDKVSWEKMSNFQYSVNEYAGIESYLEVRNIPATPAVIPSKAQQESFVEIGKRIDHWYVGSNKYDSDANYQLRTKNLNSYLSKGVANIPHVNANGTVNGSGLYPMDYHAKTVDGVKLKTFRNISEENLIQLAYDYKKNGNQASLNKALDLFEWFYDQGWADGSALGTLRFEMLRSAGFHHSVMMLRKELGSRFSQISNAERWFSLFGTAYADPTQPGEL
ncbi:MAG: chondroitinase family protein, partial [Bacteroidaceae bacterium]